MVEEEKGPGEEGERYSGHDGEVSSQCFAKLSPTMIVYMSAFVSSLTSVLLGYGEYTGTMTGLYRNRIRNRTRYRIRNRTRCRIRYRTRYRTRNRTRDRTRYRYRNCNRNRYLNVPHLGPAGIR